MKCLSPSGYRKTVICIDLKTIRWKAPAAEPRSATGEDDARRLATTETNDDHRWASLWKSQNLHKLEETAHFGKEHKR